MRLHECRSADQARRWQPAVSSPPTGEGGREWIVASGVDLGIACRSTVSDVQALGDHGPDRDGAQRRLESKYVPEDVHRSCRHSTGRRDPGSES